MLRMRRWIAATPLMLGLGLLPGFLFAKTLTVCTENAPEGFDIARYESSTTQDAAGETLYDRLLDFERGSSRVLPGLAERYQVSRDGKTYTFYLRHGVSFHRTDYFQPTRDLNADDVLFSFQRMLDPSSPWYKAAPAGFPFAASLDLPKLVRKVERVDDYTVRFSLSRPEAPFVADLAMGFASIFSKEYADQLQRTGQLEDLNQHPIGTGPFVFKRYDKDQAVRLLANRHYWRGAPRIDELVLSITPDHNIRVQRLLAGECQFAIQPKPESVALMRRNKDVVVTGTPALMTAYVAPNATRAPMSDKRFRQALWMSVDKPAFLQAIYGGLAQQAYTPFPPAMWSFNTTLKDYKFDVAKARRLVKESGYDGHELTLWARNGGLVDARKAAELLQADWAKIGVKIKVVQLEWGEVLKRSARGEHDLVFLNWISDNGDPDNFLTPTTSCAGVTSGSNRARWCNPAFDELLARARASSDLPERSHLYEQAQAMFMQEAPWIPLVHPVLPVAYRKTVRGFVPSPFGAHDFYPVWLN